MKTKTRPILITVTFLCLAAAGPKTQAVSPPPDGGYPGGNTAEGQSALLSLTTGTYNTAIGVYSLLSNTTAKFNTGVGAGTLLLNTADENTATGAGALFSNTTGGFNTATGTFALFSNTTGTGNTAMGDGALLHNITGDGNTATGGSALFVNTTGSNNTANGTGALFNNGTGTGNTASGNGALQSNTAGNFNTANGDDALLVNATGNNNTANGFAALLSNTTGSFNVALGSGAGSNLTTGDRNIDIGNAGVEGESDTIRIGSVQTATFIAGISGQTASGGVGVFVNADGKLGTSTSSRRFKDEIKPMDKASEAIHALKPVTFRYKQELDPDRIPQFGLVAEDVEKVHPDLVVRDARGEVYTVRYETVNAMLLNEFLKEHKKVAGQEATIAAQKREFQAKIGELEATIAQQQQKGMEALTARLNEQAAQIQNVSAQAAVTKGERQLAADDP
jgi:hypothetical protein